MAEDKCNALLSDWTPSDAVDFTPASPLPWTFDEDDCFVDDAKGDCVLIDGGEVWRGDLRYIVTACNAYPALRARVAELERERARYGARVTELQDERGTALRELARVRELVRMHKRERWGLEGLSDRPGEVLNESDRMLYEAVARESPAPTPPATGGDDDD